jgi:RNA polymerase sigma-70 factor (ECF subfamily)
MAWMRGLARSLLADPTAADDVAQEAWIAAIAHPPLADRPLEPWLARVVRNLAWKRRRGEARRALHERAACADRAVPGPEATAERLELQRTVLAAIEAISEPFRTTVVERYLEGRSSAEIARALGVPEGTVRWRLKRGLAELRLRLDTRSGGREAWSALFVALLPLAPPPDLAAGGAGPGASTWPTVQSGVFTMIAASKIVLFAALGAAAVGFVLWRSGEPERGGPGPVARAALAPADEPARLAAAEGVAAARTEPREAPAARETGPAASAPAPAPALAPEAPPTEALVVMRFVDGSGAPWSGVSVRELQSEELRGTSDPDGRVELWLAARGSGKRSSDGPSDLSSEWTVQLLARRIGCATRLVRAVAAAGRTTDLGDVLLGPGARIEGRVVDEHGVAVAGAEVGLATAEPFAGEREEQDGHDSLDRASFDEGLARRHGARGFDRTRQEQSDAGGAYVLDGVEPGRWRVWAHAKEMRYGWTEPLVVVAGASLSRIDVRLPALLATDRITGIVLDPAGKPLPSARVTSAYQLENESGSSTEDVGPDGRFELVLYREAIHSFIASDPEHRYADAIATDVAPGVRDLELRLGEKRVFEVSARDRDGRPVESCRFELHVRVAGAASTDRTVERKAPGLYALALPARPFRLLVEADGYLPVRFEELRPESVGARLEVVLDTAPRIRGRVLAQRKPVANARVSLHRPVGEEKYVRNGFECVYEFDPVSEAASDADGRFELTCKSTERVWLRATSPGWVVGELGPLDPLDSLDERELRVELTLGGAIEGRVLLPDGADGAGIVVGINHGDGHARTLRAGLDGRFRFDHLAPGAWQVLRCQSELDPNTTTIMTSDERSEIEWSCTVEAGRTTHHDLDLSRP